MIYNFLWLAFCLAISFSRLHGQSSADDGLIHFRTFGWGVAPSDLYYESKGKDVRLAVYESARSPFNEHRKSETIVFYRLVPGPEGKLVREEAAMARISASGPWPLLIFMKSTDSPKRYRVVAISDDLKTFPIPSVRFVNLTPIELYVKYGEKAFSIPGKGMETLDLEAAEKPETRFTTVQAIINGDVRMLYSNNWAVRSIQRTLVFIFPQEGELGVMRIVDDVNQYAAPVSNR